MRRIALLLFALAGCRTVAYEVARDARARQIAREEVRKGEERERERTAYRATVLTAQSWIAREPCSEKTLAETESRCEADGKVLDRYEPARDDIDGEPICRISYSCTMDRRPRAKAIEPPPEEEPPPPKPARAVFKPEG